MEISSRSVGACVHFKPDRLSSLTLLAIALWLACGATSLLAQVGADRRPPKPEPRPPNPVVKPHKAPPPTSRNRTTAAANRMTINDRVEDALEKANKARDEKRYDEAASFYRKALSLNSKEARAYYGLGNISFDQGDYAGAANSYEQVSRLRGGDPDISIRIGYLYSKLGDYQKAIEKFEAVIRAKPEFEYGMFLLAWNYLYKNDGTNAASTAKRYLERNGWKDLYGALIGYVGYRQSNQLIMAENFLRNATEMISVRDWPYPIIKYLKKEMTAVALLAQATDRGRLTEVKTYIGLDISLPNHNREALEHLRWVKENGDHEYFEYPLAVEELGRLKR